MSGLLWLVFSAGYVAAAFQASRHLYGRWAYTDWRASCKRSAWRGTVTFDEYDYGIGGEAAGAFAVCLSALPFVVAYLALGGSTGGYGIAPKSHRDAQRIERDRARLAELEAELLKF